MLQMQAVFCEIVHMQYFQLKSHIYICMSQV